MFQFFIKEIHCYIVYYKPTSLNIKRHQWRPKNGFCLRKNCLGDNFTKITCECAHIRFTFEQIYSILISGWWSSSLLQTHFVLLADKTDVRQILSAATCRRIQTENKSHVVLLPLQYARVDVQNITLHFHNECVIMSYLSGCTFPLLLSFVKECDSLLAEHTRSPVHTYENKSTCAWQGSV